ncbi:MAG TPA: cytochrome b/b6 domain-containing protein [Casimicrobiaceae bacterium]|nr:cytochrome b/b6 domain-containing protein [Casimicrobiaceae bacterium]
MASPTANAPAASGYLYYRHTLPVRIMHWINVVALTVLLMSGLSIFNAHPALYWGRSSYTGAPPLLEMRAIDRGDLGYRGITRLLGHEYDTTGVLGLSKQADGRLASRGFPWWATIPDNQWLSLARSWHFFFAWVLLINGLVYVAYSAASRHLSRDLAPDRSDWRSFGRSIVDHLKFRHPTGEAAKRYNVLQKLAYLTIIFVLLPLVILMGIAMSPWMNTVAPGWVDFFGGRQSARTIHFIAAWLLVAFVLIHVFEVIVSGLWNHLRSMITGRYRIRTQARHG